MFACGNYPNHAPFLDSVRGEADAQVRRLRRHPSVALFCGNNEDYQIAEDEVGYRYGDQGDGGFPARQIYEQVCCASLFLTAADLSSFFQR